MWRMIVKFLIAITLIALICLSISNLQDKSFLQNQDIKNMPKHYTEEALSQGKLQVIQYETTVIGTNQTIQRRAMVYLPSGYDTDNQYDIMYLIHGRGGDYRTWLGTPGRPGRFKFVLDHMIQDNVIEPLIVVTPSLNYSYGK